MSIAYKLQPYKQIKRSMSANVILPCKVQPGAEVPPLAKSKNSYFCISVI